MVNPKLSYYLREQGNGMWRFRTRQAMRLGNFLLIPEGLFVIAAMGWEGDRFVVDVE